MVPNSTLSFLGIGTIFYLLILIGFEQIPLASNYPNKESPFEHLAISPGLEDSILRSTANFAELITHPSVIDITSSSASNSSDSSPLEISEMDLRWIRSSPQSKMIKKFSDNDCGKVLSAFRQEHQAFAEIFITDRQGFNVCQTNKTSDFYQADEEWWVSAYHSGKGKRYFGKIEYDSSARMEGLAVALPVKDSTGQVIGIAKAVLNLTRILGQS